MATVDDLLSNPNNLNLANVVLICTTRNDGYSKTYGGQHLFETKVVGINHYQVVAKTWDSQSQSLIDNSLPIVEYQNGQLEFIDRELNDVYTNYGREKDTTVNDNNAPYYLIRAWQAFVSHKYANATYDTFIVKKDDFLQLNTNPTNPVNPTDAEYDLGTSKIKIPSKLDVDEDYEINSNK